MKKKNRSAGALELGGPDPDPQAALARILGVDVECEPCPGEYMLDLTKLVMKRPPQPEPLKTPCQQRVLSEDYFWEE